MWLRDGQTLQVGRTEYADLCISDDPLMSRVHFALDSDSGMIRIRDLGSRNGTYVNGQLIKIQELNHGDMIVAGQTRFDVVVDRSESSSPQAGAPNQTSQPGQMSVTGDQYAAPGGQSVSGVPGGVPAGQGLPVNPAAGYPNASVPGGTPQGGQVAPNAAPPGGAAPGGPIPGGAVPGAPVPGAPVPGGAVPGAPMPGGAVPGSVPPPTFTPGQGSVTGQFPGATPYPPQGPAGGPVPNDAPSQFTNGSVPTGNMGVPGNVGPGMQGSASQYPPATNYPSTGPGAIPAGPAGQAPVSQPPIGQPPAGQSPLATPPQNPIPPNQIPSSPLPGSQFPGNQAPGQPGDASQVPIQPSQPNGPIDPVSGSALSPFATPPDDSGRLPFVPPPGSADYQPNDPDASAQWGGTPAPPTGAGMDPNEVTMPGLAPPAFDGSLSRTPFDSISGDDAAAANSPFRGPIDVPGEELGNEELDGDETKIGTPADYDFSSSVDKPATNSGPPIPLPPQSGPPELPPGIPSSEGPVIVPPIDDEPNPPAGTDPTSPVVDSGDEAPADPPEGLYDSSMNPFGPRESRAPASPSDSMRTLEGGTPFGDGESDAEPQGDQSPGGPDDDKDDSASALAKDSFANPATGQPDLEATMMAGEFSSSDLAMKTIAPADSGISNDPLAGSKILKEDLPASEVADHANRPARSGDGQEVDEQPKQVEDGESQIVKAGNTANHATMMFDAPLDESTMAYASFSSVFANVAYIETTSPTGLSCYTNHGEKSSPSDIAKSLIERNQVYLFVNLARISPDSRAMLESNPSHPMYTKVSGDLVLISKTDPVDLVSLIKDNWGRDAIVLMITGLMKAKVVESMTSHLGAYSFPSVLYAELENTPVENSRSLFQKYEALMVEVPQSDGWKIYRSPDLKGDWMSLGMPCPPASK